MRKVRAPATVLGFASLVALACVPCDDSACTSMLGVTLHEPDGGPLHPATYIIERDPPPDHLDLRVSHDGTVILDRRVDAHHDPIDRRCDPDCVLSTPEVDFER